MGSNFFESKSITLNWNPYRGISTLNEFYLSPTTLLNHEFDHIVEFLSNPERYGMNSIQDDNNLYQSKEEERVITGSEQFTARALGEISENEVTRTDHSGFAFQTESPISNKPLYKDEENEFVIYGIRP